MVDKQAEILFVLYGRDGVVENIIEVLTFDVHRKHCPKWPRWQGVELFMLCSVGGEHEGDWNSKESIGTERNLRGRLS